MHLGKVGRGSGDRQLCMPLNKHYMKGHDNTQYFPILESQQPLKEEKKMDKVGELCVPDSERK